MPHQNLAIIMGHLGGDPDIRYTQSGDCVANMSVALSRRWKDNDGEWQEKTTWVKVVAWKYLAERAGEKLQKGDPVFVKGRLDEQEWEDQDGNQRRAMRIIADDLQPLHGRKSDNNENGDRGNNGRNNSRNSSNSRRSDPPPRSTSSYDADEDIPF